METIFYNEKKYLPVLNTVINNYKNVFAVEYLENRHPRGLQPGAGPDVPGQSDTVPVLLGLDVVLVSLTHRHLTEFLLSL